MAANHSAISSMDDISFKKAVYRAILHEMGVAGLARYMTEQFAAARDFTRERQQYKHDLSVEEALRELEKVDIDTIDSFVLDLDSRPEPRLGG